MSLSEPRDTSTTPPQAPLVDASQGSAQVPAAPVLIPFRAQLSLFRQRIVLTLRYILRPFYRLPIDDLREQQIEESFRRLMENDRRLLASHNKLIETSNQLQRRVLFYEKHIPRMRELKREFDREEERIQRAAEAPQREASEMHEHGMLEVPSRNGNGHRPLIEIVRP